MTLFPDFIAYFSSSKQQEYLSSLTDGDQIYLDGTFKVIPYDCKQMITIRAAKKNSKTSHLVAIIILRLRKLSPSIENKSLYIVTDFEIGFHNAIKEIFPNFTRIGCYFHFKKAIKQKLSSKFKALYSKNNKASLEQYPQIMQTFVTKYSQILYEDAKSFITYMEKTWLKNTSTYPPTFFGFY